ncbi:MAG: GNAT family N-acetyltransferase [Casimicrobiaceae bacterium]
MDVTLITAPDEFVALRPALDDLAGRCVQPCAFLTFAWLDAAWQWRRDSASLYLLCCRDEGRLVGLLPLVRMHAAETLGARPLEFLAVPDTQVCDAIVESARRDAVSGALAEALARRRGEWDVVRLRYLPRDSVMATVVARALLERGIRSESREATANYFVALTTSWDVYYGGRSRRLKKSVNLVANRLAKTGAITIECNAAKPGEFLDVDGLVAGIADVSARSWKAVTGNSLDRPGPNAFIRRLTEHGAACGWLSVWTLRVDGRALATEYQLVADGNVYALRSDFDADCEQTSPGSHLSRHLLEHLFGRGLERYLMGPGSNAYKLRWATASEPVYEMTVYGRSARGRLLLFWELAVKPPLRRLRERLRIARAPASESGAQEENQGSRERAE